MHADVRSPDDVIAFSPDDVIAFSPDDVIAFLTGPFSKLVIKDSKTMFMMRSGQVPLRTKDGGATWTPLTSAAPLFKYGATFDLDISWSGKTIVMHGGDLSAIARQEYANQYIDWFSPRICSRTLMGDTPTTTTGGRRCTPPVFSRGGSLLLQFLLTDALLMTSSHSEGTARRCGSRLTKERHGPTKPATWSPSRLGEAFGTRKTFTLSLVAKGSQSSGTLTSKRCGATGVRWGVGYCGLWRLGLGWGAMNGSGGWYVWYVGCVTAQYTHGLICYASG